MIDVSVIIPVYNSEQYLRQCLDSVRNQTLESIEIICVDDGSTDNSLCILKEYEKTDNRFVVITKENAGAGAARNKGMACAKGKYLLFLDADDFFEPNMLECAWKQAEELQAQIVVFESDQYYMDKKKYVFNPFTVVRKNLPPYQPFNHRQIAGNLYTTFVGWAWDKLFLRAFVESHNLAFQEQRTTNDLFFVYAALSSAKQIGFVKERLVHQRRGSNDTLSVTRERSWGCFYEALLALRQYLQERNIYWELEQDFINYSLHFSLWNYKTLAQPTKNLLEKKLCEAWWGELEIEKHKQAYFYDKGEYQIYQGIKKRYDKKFNKKE